MQQTSPHQKNGFVTIFFKLLIRLFNCIVTKVCQTYIQRVIYINWLISLNENCNELY